MDHPERLVPLFFICWFAAGLVGMAAIGDGITYWTGLSPVLSWPIGFLIGSIPPLGAILTFYGALVAWHMAWYWAAVIAFPSIAIVPVAGALGGIGWLGKRVRPNTGTPAV